MAYRITKEHVWAGEIPDERDGMAGKLRALSEGGVNLELIVGRREWTGRGLLFISPLRTVEEIDIAEKAGFAKGELVRTLRIEGPNATGLGARISTALSRAEINIRAYTAAALGEMSVTNIAFDSDADSNRARELLDRELNQP
jgi:hypothetical protein